MPGRSGSEVRLPLATRLAFGFGDTAGAVFAVLYGFFMQAFLLDVAGLAPVAVGAIFAISQIWDAILDPVVGGLSDQTRSRWGRRRPWLLFGALPFGLAFFLHWLVPPLAGAGLFAYYLIVGLLLRTGFTAVNVPYTALTPDLAPDYDGRTQLTFYRFTFSILGGLVAVVLHPVLVGLGGNVYTGHALSAGIWMLVIVAATWTCFAGTREAPPPARRAAPLPAARRLALIVGNRPYLMVTAIYLLSWLALQFVQVNLLLYARYWLGAEAQFTGFVAVLQITAAGFLGVWALVSSRLGKSVAYVAGAALWTVTLCALFFVQPGQTVAVYALSFFAGVGVSVAYLVPWSMLPDTIEHNELATGERQEGVFYGMFVFLQKVGLSIGLALSGFALGAAGYVTPRVIDGAVQAVTQPEAVTLTLRLFVSFVPAAFLLISVPVALAYPITRTRHAEIREALAAKAAARG